VRRTGGGGAQLVRVAGSRLSGTAYWGWDARERTKHLRRVAGNGGSMYSHDPFNSERRLGAFYEKFLLGWTIFS